MAPAHSRVLPLSYLSRTPTAEAHVEKAALFLSAALLQSFLTLLCSIKEHHLSNMGRRSLERQLLLGSDEACSPRTTHRSQYSLDCPLPPSCCAWQSSAMPSVCCPPSPPISKQKTSQKQPLGDERAYLAYTSQAQWEVRAGTQKGTDQEFVKECCFLSMACSGVTPPTVG